MHILCLLYTLSVSWYYPNSKRSHILYKDNISLVSSDGIKSGTNIGSANIKNDINKYFMIEVNLRGNYIRFIGPSFNSNDFGFDISFLSKPFRIGISLLCSNKFDAGFGIISVKKSDLLHLKMKNNDTIEDINFTPSALLVRSDFTMTNLRTELPLIIKNNLNSLPNNTNNNEIGYNYYSYNQLNDVLIQSKLIEMNNDLINNEKILMNICEYCGITSWDINNKSAHIIINNSNDNKICYAILKDAGSRIHTILCNEWIGISENNKIFRYVFKWFGNTVSRFKIHMSIGIGTPDCDLQLSDSERGIGFVPNSACWWHHGTESVMVRNRTRLNRDKIVGITLGKGGVKKELLNGENEDNMYFLMEINLLTNFVKFIGTSMVHIDNMGFSIQSIQKPFRIGVSFKCIAQNGLGMGLVKLN